MDSDQVYTKFEEWILGIVKKEKPIDNIVAYNIGIFKTPVSYSLYMMGSKKYDADDSDWACKQDYNPDAMYFDFPKTYSKDKKPEEIETEVVSFAKKVIKNKDYKGSFLAKAKALTTGFDDGELFLIH